MLEVASGNIETGKKYIIGNINQSGTGTITYNFVTYNIGGQFLGIAGITTYASTLTAKVYIDDSAVDFISHETAEIGEEMIYPEGIDIINQTTAENFSKTDAVFPESIKFCIQVTAEGKRSNRSQITRKRN